MSNESLNNLDALFRAEIRTLYCVENRLAEALPDFQKAASDDDLKTIISRHQDEVQQQIERLERVAQQLDFDLGDTQCDSLDGLISDGKNLLDKTTENHVRDAAIIATAQRIHHYQIACYGTACTFAKLLDHADELELLKQSIDEEKSVDKALTQIAQSEVNEMAM